MAEPSHRNARLMLVAAAVLWSTSGLFVRGLQLPTALHLESPSLSTLQIAFYRSFFAGLVLLPMLQRCEIRFRTAMLPLVASFGVMTGLFLSAIGRGPAANAILLQNTAPVWVFAIGILLLNERADRRSVQAVMLGLAGALIIVAGNWPRGLAPEEQGIQVEILLMATGSGFFYALVIAFLRFLRTESPVWLSILNLGGGAIVLAAALFAIHGFAQSWDWLAQPTADQLVYLAVFGSLQMALPYVLFSRGLRTVSSQEAGIITLIEPLLNPLWAYLIAPGQETPTAWTCLGGAVLMTALLWRYLPLRRRASQVRRRP